MRQRSLLFVLVVLFASPVLAQSSNAPTNRLSGTWTGFAGPQAPASNDTSAALRFGFKEVSEWVTKTADLVPADKYSYRPVQTVRTVGQQIGHIVDSYNYFCARVTNPNVQWSDAAEKGATDKATLVGKLKQATDACNAAYGGTSASNALMANIAHVNLHYGNLITYLRMLGLTPPSS